MPSSTLTLDVSDRESNDDCMSMHCLLLKDNAVDAEKPAPHINRHYLAKSYFAPLSAVLGAGLVACCLGAHLRLFGVASLLLFSLHVLLTACLRPEVIAKYLYFYFYTCLNVAGCAVIEYSNVYLIELRASSCFAGSLPLLVLSRWTMLVLFVAYESMTKSKGDAGIWHQGNPRHLNLLTLAIAICLCVMFAAVAPNPSFLMGFDRFEYNKTLSPILVKMKSWIDLLVVIPLVSIRENGDKIGILAIVLYLLYSVWTGIKFDSFFALLCMVILVNYDSIISLDRARIRAAMMRIAIVIAALIGCAILLHGLTTVQSNADYISERLAQQGQLWWKTYSLCDGEIHPEQIEKEIGGIWAPTSFDKNINAAYGIYNIMYLTTPGNVVDNKLNSGSRYTEAGYATALYCLGPIGTIMYSLILGLAIAVINNAFVKAAAQCRLLESLLLARISLFLQVAVRMAVFSAFFTTPSLASYGLLVLLVLCRRERAVVLRKRKHHYLSSELSVSEVRGCGM